MKLYSNKKYNTIAMYVLLVVAISILLVICLFKFDGLLKILNFLISAAMPMIVGFVLAYALNPLMLYIEKYLKKILCKKKNRAKLVRVISLVLTFVLFLSVVFGLISVVAPEVVRSLANIIDSIPGALTRLQKWATNILEDYPKVLDVVKREINDVSKYIDSFSDDIQPFLMNILDGVWVGVTGAFSYIKNFFLGLIVAIYLLLSKEKMQAQLKKSLMAVMSRPKCEKLFRISNDSNKIFSGFITGKIIDSIIIGLLCFIGVTIMNMPYKVMISVVIGVTNIIPFFGPFIGAIPCAFLVMLSEPKKVILFVIFIFLLQQLDGNVIGPTILGDSTGLPAFWVLFSILLGSGLFGFIGMLLGVPTFAVIYNLFKNYINGKLKSKNMSTITDDYRGDVMHMYERPPRPSEYLSEEDIEIMQQTLTNSPIEEIVE